MIRSMYSDSSLPRSFKGVPICRLTYEDYGGFSHSLKDYKVFIFLKKDYIERFKPRSREVFEELLSGSTSTPSRKVVDNNVVP